MKKIPLEDLMPHLRTALAIEVVEHPSSRRYPNEGPPPLGPIPVITDDFYLGESDQEEFLHVTLEDPDGDCAEDTIPLSFHKVDNPYVEVTGDQVKLCAYADLVCDDTVFPVTIRIVAPLQLERLFP